MSLTLLEAQSRLPDLIHSLSPGEEVTITEDNRTVAKIVVPLPEELILVEERRPIYGRGKGAIIILSEDDEHLEDFAEYM